MKGVLYTGMDVRDLPPLTEEEKKTVPALMGKGVGRFLDDLIMGVISEHQAGSSEGGDSLLEEKLK